MPYIAINSDNVKPAATFGRRSKPAAQYDREHQHELDWMDFKATTRRAPQEKENRPPSPSGLDSSMANMSIDEPVLNLSKQRVQRRSLLPLDPQQRPQVSAQHSSRSIRTMSSQVQQPQLGPLGANGQRRLSTQSTVTMSSASSRLSSYDPLKSMGVYVDPAAAAKSEIVATPPLPGSPQFVAAATAAAEYPTAERNKSPSPTPTQQQPPLQPLHARASSSLSYRRVSAASTQTTATTQSAAPAPNSRGPGSRRSFLGLSSKRSSSSISMTSSGRRSSTIQDIRRSIISFSSSSSSLFKLSQSPNPQTSSRVQPSMISLPTPSAVTREKMSNKMKTSQSMLSLGPDGQHAQTQEFAESQLANLLRLSTHGSVRPFGELIAGEPRALVKIGEASYSEVFAAGDTVYKVIPFGSLGQTPINEISQEIEIGKLVNAHDGFAKLLAAHVVQGEYEPTLLAAWDGYAAENVSENARPNFEADQLYCILVMAHAGEALETFKLRDSHEAFDIFRQVLWALAAAEANLEFEHRDLHWGNIVIERMSSGVRVSVIDFTLSRARPAPATPRPGEAPSNPADRTSFYTRLDHPDFFRGKGDYQFDIYRYMQRLLVSRSRDQSVPDWSLFEPRTNVLWLHYLVLKLLDKLDQTANSPKHKSDNVYLARLQSLTSTLDITNRRRFLSHKVKSACDLLLWGQKHGFW